MTLQSRLRLAKGAAHFARGLRSRPLWTAAALRRLAFLPPVHPSPPKRAQRWLSAMTDPVTSIVILSERSLPAVAGESKDLYLPRLLPLPARWLALRCIVRRSSSCDTRTRACALLYSSCKGTASAVP